MIRFIPGYLYKLAKNYDSWFYATEENGIKDKNAIEKRISYQFKAGQQLVFCGEGPGLTSVNKSLEFYDINSGEPLQIYYSLENKYPPAREMLLAEISPIFIDRGNSQPTKINAFEYGHQYGLYKNYGPFKTETTLVFMGITQISSEEITIYFFDVTEQKPIQFKFKPDIEAQIGKDIRPKEMRQAFTDEGLWHDKKKSFFQQGHLYIPKSNYEAWHYILERDADNGKYNLVKKPYALLKADEELIFMGSYYLYSGNVFWFYDKKATGLKPLKFSDGRMYPYRDHLLGDLKVIFIDKGAWEKKGDFKTGQIYVVKHAYDLWRLIRGGTASGVPLNKRQIYGRLRIGDRLKYMGIGVETVTGERGWDQIESYQFQNIISGDQINVEFYTETTPYKNMVFTELNLAFGI